MTKIYLDNAATTPILTEAADHMYKSLLHDYGNPSSTHSFGRKSKALLETARKNIAAHFNVSASELVFTSGGSEADNLILSNAVVNLGVKEIITSKIEHHAVLHTLEYLKKTYGIKIQYVKLTQSGGIDMLDLEKLISNSKQKTLVSLMYVNNETGKLLNIEKTTELCQKNGVLFHSDTVQAIGKYQLDLQKIPIDFIAASAHKFHGPKGVGFAFFRKGTGIAPIIHGGEQEHGARAGTENLQSIMGMEFALNSAYYNLKEDRDYIMGLKTFLVKSLQTNFPDIQFNANSDNTNDNSYNIINIRLRKDVPMLLFQLDLKGIAVSGGSACQSGSQTGSHVLRNLLTLEENKNTSLRVSLSKFNSKKELMLFTQTLKDIVEE